MDETTFTDEELAATLEADKLAVDRAVAAGLRVDPLVRDRFHARTARIREAIFQKHGYVDGAQFRLPSVIE